jgi:ADP-ribosylglycohydrolase
MEFNKLQISSLIFGTAIGDALGVPVEFKSRGHFLVFSC